MNEKNTKNKLKIDRPKIADVVIVGAGAAGLSAALFLVRARRSTIVYDWGKTRISATGKIHEYLTFEGVTPAEFLARGSREIKKYGGEIRNEKVLKIEPTTNSLFQVHTDHETVMAKTVVIATGLVDVLPETPGLREGWGRDVHVCPCFTGYELHNQKLVVFGLPERLGQAGKFLTGWSKNVTVVSRQEFEPAVSKKLKAAGVEVVKDEVAALIRKKDDLQSVLTEEGKEIPCDGVFISTAMRAASDLAATLCDVDDSGFAITDENGKTSRDGVWVIGNANDPIGHLAHSVAAGTRVGPMVTDYIIEQALAKIIG